MNEKRLDDTAEYVCSSMGNRRRVEASDASRLEFSRESKQKGVAAVRSNELDPDRGSIATLTDRNRYRRLAREAERRREQPNTQRFAFAEMPGTLMGDWRDQHISRAEPLADRPDELLRNVEGLRHGVRGQQGPALCGFESRGIDLRVGRCAAENLTEPGDGLGANRVDGHVRRRGPFETAFAENSKCSWMIDANVMARCAQRRAHGIDRRDRLLVDSQADDWVMTKQCHTTSISESITSITTSITKSITTSMTTSRSTVDRRRRKGFRREQRPHQTEIADRAGQHVLLPHRANIGRPRWRDRIHDAPRRLQGE